MMTTGKSILTYLETCDELEIMFIDGRVDFIKQPFDGPMAVEEFMELIDKITKEKHRGKMKISRTGKDKKYVHISWERSLKE